MHSGTFLAARKIPARAALLRIGTLAGILVVTALIGWKLGWFGYRHTLEHVARLRRSHSFATFAIGFVVVYGVGSALGVPGMPFTVASGVLFGTLLGSALSWFGAMVGSVVGYWLARSIAHDVVLRWVHR